jgi:hypothetical protein
MFAKSSSEADWQGWMTGLLDSSLDELEQAERSRDAVTIATTKIPKFFFIITSIDNV